MPCGHTVNMRGFGPFMSQRGSHNKAFVLPLVYRELVFSTVSAVLWCEKSFGPLGHQDAGNCDGMMSEQMKPSPLPKIFPPLLLSFFLSEAGPLLCCVMGQRLQGQAGH